VEAVEAIGAIGSGVTVLHGLTSKNWTTAHRVFTIGGIVAAVGNLLSNRPLSLAPPQPVAVEVMMGRVYRRTDQLDDDLSRTSPPTTRLSAPELHLCSPLGHASSPRNVVQPATPSRIATAISTSDAVAARTSRLGARISG